MSSFCTIEIEEMELWTRIGVPQAERALPQRLLVSVSFDVPVPVGDALDNTVDYAAVAACLQEVAAQGERQLVETFVGDLGHAVLRQFTQIQEIFVSCDKFILPATRCIRVSTHVKRV